MPTKILIVRFSSIGDIVLTTPVIRCLKKQYSGEVEIHYLTKLTFAPILKANPYVNKILSIDKDVKEVSQQLKNEDYDFVIDLHGNLRSAIVKKIVNAKSLRFDKLNVEKWLMVNFKMDRLPALHIVDRYMECVKSLSIKNDNEGLDYFIPTEDEIDINSLPVEFQNGFIGFAIGGQHYTKKLPIEKVIEICSKLNMPVVILGGKEDKEDGDKIANSVETAIYNGAGKYKINQSASLVKQANKIITNDTGIMHIAVAFEKDIISVWGNTIPKFGMYPYLPEGKGSSYIAEVNNLSCRPCTKLGYDKCPKGHFKCMMDIDVDAIILEVNTA